jgi:hypothetical protein
VIDGERIVTTPTHPYITPDGWSEAQNLVPGEEVLRRGGERGTIVALYWTYSLAQRHDLTVDVAHSFFVGEGEWWVHNTGPCDPAWVTPGSLPGDEEAAVIDTLSHIDSRTQPAGSTGTNWGIPHVNREGYLPASAGDTFSEYRVAALGHAEPDRSKRHDESCLLHLDSLRPRWAASTLRKSQMMEPGVYRLKGNRGLRHVLREPTTAALVLAPGARDKTTWGLAVVRSLPLRPALDGPPFSWDSLRDSILGGIESMDVSTIVLVWPEADEMRGASPTDYDTAVQILGEVAGLVARADVTRDKPKTLLVALDRDD